MLKQRASFNQLFALKESARKGGIDGFRCIWGIRKDGIGRNQIHGLCRPCRPLGGPSCSRIHRFVLLSFHALEAPLKFRSFVS